MEEKSGLGIEDADRRIRRATIATARQTFGVAAAFMATRTAGGQRIAERDGLHDERWDTVVVRPGLGLGGRVLVESRPLAVTDYLNDSTITGDYRSIVSTEGLRAIVCVPVTAGGRVEALLWLANQEPASLADRLIDGAYELAGMAGLAQGLARERASLAGQARAALRSNDVLALRALAGRLAGARKAADTHGLTARETEVLHLLALGATNADIARDLVIAKSTAKEHVRNVSTKLGARSRLEAVAKARDAGMI
jgi:DNA-binding CsgD family transcriptional regulator